MIKIVNYGSGNIQAILNIYKKLNIACTVADCPEALDGADKLILPGVGAFDETMGQLVASGFKDKLDYLVKEQHMPIMGICVGMHLLADSSEEGTLSGLGYVSGKVKKFSAERFTQKPFLPHLGWNGIEPTAAHPILEGIDQGRGFYFLHSYYFEPTSPESILTQTNYGGLYASGVYNNNVYGMQFHPEKSHGNGIRLFQNFANL